MPSRVEWRGVGRHFVSRDICVMNTHTVGAMKVTALSSVLSLALTLMEIGAPSDFLNGWLKMALLGSTYMTMHAAVTVYSDLKGAAAADTTN
jgi:hypothetical protein